MIVSRSDEGVGRHRRSSIIDESRVGDRVVLYHRDSGDALVLNPTGSLLWQLLATPNTTRDLAAGLHARFPPLTAQQALSDASDFIDALREHDAIISGDT